MIMNFFGNLMGPTSNATSNEEYEQFMRNFTQGFQAGVNASSSFQAQSQGSAEKSKVPAAISFLFGSSNGLIFVLTCTFYLESVLSFIDCSWLESLSCRLLRYRIALRAAILLSLSLGHSGAGGSVKQRSSVYGMDFNAAERDFANEFGRFARHGDR